ncbi:PPPDE putative thiol peptidase family protein [Striga hermonthica]|uniref:PPPDE putative thiol peptidase family protein n=1 Tax=Striga hermonthica TaxID=68872 RepID=A0A9N7MH95_STRHE|nr:PPPDE putative thiol peptidase family protein [Striga hermonthica]
MLCRKSSVKRRRGSAHQVNLNVYDLTSINGYAYWLGLGVYHSAVEVNGVEYAFGGHEYETTGIFEGEPKKCDGFTFRKSIVIGWTDLSPGEVTTTMEQLGHKYRGNTYNLITKNCNHFCNDACIQLTGNPIPNWVNRLARIGFLCKCIIPTSLNSRIVGVGERKIGGKSSEMEKKNLKSLSCRFPNSSTSQPPKASFPSLPLL